MIFRGDSRAIRIINVRNWYSGVQPILSAKDMADKNVEHLGVMAYAAHYQWIPERPPLQDLINVTLNSTSGRVGEPVSTRSLN